MSLSVQLLAGCRATALCTVRFVYGLASYALPLMTQGTGSEDTAKYIMVTYRHCPDPIFIVTAKTTVHVAAPHSTLI